MKRGFTLIELLAVIVILAIIALIAVPIVISIVDDSKKSSAKESIKLYLDTAEKFIAKRQMEKPTFNPTECTINGNKITCDEEEIEIEMKGEVPKTGTIRFGEGMVISGMNIELDNLYYQVNNGELSEGTEDKKHAILLKDTGTQGISPGDKYIYQVNNNDIFNFYVLSIEGDKVNLIMDRNICSNGKPATKNNTCLTAWHAGSNDNTYGPDTAIQFLYDGTKEWINVTDMELTYTDENNVGTNNGYTGIATSGGITTITGKPTSKVTAIGTSSKPLKARLPRLDEVMEASCDFAVRPSCKSWIVENLDLFKYHCEICLISYSDTPKISNIEGYWLLSSGPDISSDAVAVGLGNFYYNNSNDVNYVGIRPVITVPKTYLSN